MNTPVKIAAARRLKPVAEILTILAEGGAASWMLYPLELPDVVDPLQEFAQRTGLVAQLSQDRVQKILSVAFAPYRKLAELSESEEIPLAPEPEPPKRSFRTPQATIDAFWYVVSLDDPEYLARWLKQHPCDAAELHKIWSRKCATS